MLRAAIIGVSGFGDVHYRDLLRQTEQGFMRPVAAAIINQEEEYGKCDMLRALGCELFTDWQEMLKHHAVGIDLCFIPTGIHLHTPMSVAAMRAGANVYVEKPISPTVQDVALLKEAENETGKFAAVGYQTMYADETQWMKKSLLSGRIGRMRCVKFRGLWPRFDDYYSRNNWAGKIRNKESWILDSPFNNALAHQANMTCFLAGAQFDHSAELISVQAELYKGHNIENADTACVRALTREGVKIYWFVTHCCEKSFGPEIVVEGDLGRICWNFNEVELSCLDGFKEKRTSDNIGSDAGRDKIMAAIRGRIVDSKAFICTLDIAGVQTLMMNGVHESSPVHNLDSGMIERYAEKNTTKTVIRGIDDAINNAFNQEKLFSELGLGWAKPGIQFDLTGYKRFNGGKTGFSCE